MDALSTTPSEVLLGAGIEAIYAGVDWISCTLPIGSPNEAQWYNLGVHIINSIAREGYELEAFSRNGYDGLGAGGSFFGSRHDGSYLQLSGYRAGDFLDSIRRDDLHISRMDIQTTVKYRVYARNVGQLVYRKAEDANDALVSGRRRKIWYMEGNDGGWSTYIGSPSSEQRAIVYNKAIQSADPIYERCWRWEVRYKNEHATAIARSIMADTMGRPSLCAAICASWFTLRGAKPDWGAYVPLITMPLIKEVPTDADKRLTWLKTQVRPALRWLMAHDFQEEAYEALGMVWNEVDSGYRHESDERS